MVPLKKISLLFLAAAADPSWRRRLRRRTHRRTLGSVFAGWLESYHQDTSSMHALANRSRSVQLDTADRVVVNIHLDGRINGAIVTQQVRQAGGDVLVIDPN
jgi:hypothetical protein